MKLKSFSTNILFLGLILCLGAYVNNCFATSPTLPQTLAPDRTDTTSHIDDFVIYSPGSILGDENVCDGGIPSPIKNVVSPTGDFIDLINIRWEKRTSLTSWVIIPGATSLDYSPTSISETTNYRRAVRETSHSDWQYSNVVMKRVVVGIEDVKISTIDVKCKNGSSGHAQAIVTGGTPGYEYLWSTGSELSHVGYLTAGNYTVEVKDRNGCKFKVTDIEILEPQKSVEIDYIYAFPPSCPGGNNGIIYAEADFGVHPYEYTWSTGKSGNFNENITEGVYKVTVKDALGCHHISEDILLLGPPPFSIKEKTTAVSCSGDTDGTLDVQINGGTAPYQYFWANGEKSLSQSELPAGDYDLTIQDNNGCMFQETVKIKEPNPLDLNVQKLNNKICQASINIVPDGGTAPYIYEWNDGGTGQSRSSLCPGEYEVRLIDANGCETHQKLNITSNYKKEEIEIIVTSSGVGNISNINIKLPYEKEAQVRIYSASGQLIEEFENQFSTDEKQLDLDLNFSSYSDGVYLLQVITGGLSKTAKLLISNN